MTPADLVVVSSPLQFLNAAEWRRRDTSRPADLVLLGDRAGGSAALEALVAREPRLWRDVHRRAGRPRAPRALPRLARDLADIAHRADLGRLARMLGPRAAVAFGDYRNVSQRALVAAIPHDALVLADDGSVAPQVASARAGGAAPSPERFAPGWLRTRTARALFGEQAPPAPDALIFFSIYGALIEPLLAPRDRFDGHAYEGWRAAAEGRGRDDAVWMLGANHVEAGIAGLDDYRRLIGAGAAALRARGLSGPIVYRPHRGEDRRKASAVARAAGMAFEDDGAPAEIAYLDAARRPAAVAVVASSAADTLSVIDPELAIFRFAVPDGYLRRQRDHILAVVAGHDAFNPRLAVLSTDFKMTEPAPA